MDAPSISEAAGAPARRFTYGIRVPDEVMNYPLSMMFNVGWPIYLAIMMLQPGGRGAAALWIGWRVLGAVAALFWFGICVAVPVVYACLGRTLRSFDFTIGDGVLCQHSPLGRTHVTPLEKCRVRAGWRGTRIEYKGPFGPATDERIFVPGRVATRAEIEALFCRDPI